MKSSQEKGANFRDSKGNLYLVRCYVCEPERGRENYGPAVSTGNCAWCGWSEEVEAKLRIGLEESASGKVVDLGDFSKYAGNE